MTKLLLSSPAAAATENVFAYVLTLIRNRHYESGDRLPSERDIASKLQINRAAVREGLSALEAMRVIESRPQSGIFLCDISRVASLDALVLEASMDMPMSRKQIRDLNEFRLTLELKAVALAADRRTEADLQVMHEVLEESATRLGSNEPLGEQDMQFHIAIFSATQNSVLLRAANSFWLTSQNRRDDYFNNKDNGERSLRDHLKIFEAIQDKDRDQAKELMSAHIGGVEEFWLQQMVEGSGRK